MRQIEGLGKVSCSRLSSVMGGPTAWITYRADIREEWRILGSVEALGDAQSKDPAHIVPAMRHGLETEDRAIAEFQIRHPESILGKSNIVLTHPEYSWFCGTPDLAFPTSGVEVKCPVVEHRHVLEGMPLPGEYRDQIQGYIALMGARWYWFVSYYVPPQITITEKLEPIRRPLYTEIKVKRDEAYIARALERAEIFWSYAVQDDEEAIHDYYPATDSTVAVLF